MLSEGERLPHDLRVLNNLACHIAHMAKLCHTSVRSRDSIYVDIRKLNQCLNPTSKWGISGTRKMLARETNTCRPGHVEGVSSRIS
jgi:hypothetical protein